MSKKFSFSFIALLLTFLAFLAWAMTPMSQLTGLLFVLFLSFGLMFSRRSIKQENKSDKIIGFFCLTINLIFVILIIFNYWWLPKEEAKNIQNLVACTLETKLCSDGSAIGRTGPNCEFVECPVVKTNEISKTPEQVVYDFYECSIKNMNKTPYNPDDLIDNCGYLLEENYKQSLFGLFFWRIIFQLNDTDVSRIPIGNLDVNQTGIKNETASTIVSFPPFWPQHKIKVSLLLINDKWRISNIEDITKQEAEKGEEYNDLYEVNEFTYTKNNHLFFVRKKEEFKVFDIINNLFSCGNYQNLLESDKQNLEKIRSKFSENDTGIIYHFVNALEPNPNDNTRHSNVWKVMVIPNKIGYLNLGDFQNDYGDCEAGGYFWPLNVSGKYLLLDSSCGSGALGAGCYAVSELIEPTIILK